MSGIPLVQVTIVAIFVFRGIVTNLESFLIIGIFITLVTFVAKSIAQVVI